MMDSIPFMNRLQARLCVRQHIPASVRDSTPNGKIILVSLKVDRGPGGISTIHQNPIIHTE
jgi:hypothetical protein